jgi:hypothetical protein
MKSRDKRSFKRHKIRRIDDQLKEEYVCGNNFEGFLNIFHKASTYYVALF